MTMRFKRIARTWNQVNTGCFFKIGLDHFDPVYKKLDYVTTIRVSDGVKVSISSVYNDRCIFFVEDKEKASEAATSN